MKKKAELTTTQIVLMVLALLLGAVILFFLTIGKKAFSSIMGFDIP